MSFTLKKMVAGPEGLGVAETRTRVPATFCSTVVILLVVQG